MAPAPGGPGFNFRPPIQAGNIQSSSRCPEHLPSTRILTELSRLKQRRVPEGSMSQASNICLHHQWAGSEEQTPSRKSTVATGQT